ncbi:MAG: hypothetical protein DMD66_05450 [Gemmatimonadetes bacterium]|nr:MAG: hypothetical protein DMD66_05450 [Gemmatimonadota bacterium]
MAGGARRHGVTRNTRRPLYLLGAGLLVVALVGGRWLAVETAERAWDRTFAGGEALIAARTLAQVLSALVLFTAIAWITGNLLIVYRAIGSVQMPRRLGDLEIVEAVPRRTLLGVTIVLGVILGAFLSLGTGDWWRHAVLAAAPPRFGVTDATNLGRDAGYYVSVMPWLATLQNRTLLFVVGALGIVALLYGVIGSLRIRGARIRASDQARMHLGVLLACLALVIAWGAILDPAEIVGGLHGIVDQAALSVRVPGADVVAAVAIVTAVISLAWAWRDRPTLILAGWAALLVSLTAGYFVIPGVARASSGPAGGPESADVVSRRAALERIPTRRRPSHPAKPPRGPYRCGIHRTSLPHSARRRSPSRYDPHRSLQALTPGPSGSWRRRTHRVRCVSRWKRTAASVSSPCLWRMPRCCSGPASRLRWCSPAIPSECLSSAHGAASRSPGRFRRGD